MKETAVAYISVGSNIGDSRVIISDCRAALETDGAFHDVELSPLYETEPVGEIEQPPFLNGVFHCRTSLSPGRLLERLHKIEQRFGRTHEVRWGPRTLDLDIIFYGDLQISQHDLFIPHPRMAERGFVLKPLSDLAPDLIHPILGKPVAVLYREWRLRCHHMVRPAGEGPP